MIPFQTEIMGGGLALLLATSGGLYVSNEFKASEIARLESDLALQNHAIEMLAVDVGERTIAFNNIRPEIRRIYVDRYLTDVNTSRGDCEDVEDVLDNIDTLGLF